MLRVARNLRQTSTNLRCLYSSVTYDHFPFLKELGIEKTNPGVYNGEWSQGGGEPLYSINPATNEVIASVTQASLKDYDETIARMLDANKKWMATPAPVRFKFHFFQIFLIFFG